MKVITKKTLVYFFSNMKRRKLLFGLAFCGIALASIPAILVPIYYKDFFDTLAGLGSVEEKGEKLLTIVGLILALHLINWLINRSSIFLSNVLQAKTMKDIVDHCFDYLHHHSYRFFSNRFVGSLVRKVGRLADGFLGITDSLFWDLTPLLVRVTSILIILSFSHPLLSLVILVWVLLYVAISYSFARFKLKYDAKKAEVDSQVTGYLADTITNQANIKLFAAFKDEHSTFQNLTEKHRAIRTFTWNFGAFMDTIQGLLMILLEFGIFYVAIKFWKQGILTIGDFALIQAYILQLFDWLWGFGRVVRRVYEHLADAEEMTEILNTEHEIKDPRKVTRLKVKKAKIEYQNISFNYNERREIFSNFNLVIKSGEKVAIVGPSGSGKSTLISLLFRFFDVQKGAVFIDSQDICKVTQESLREQVSLVPQDPVLFHRTLMENIRYGKRSASDKEVMRAARLAHCDKFINLLSEGYQTYVGERGIKLSGGERQRIAIARAILKNAPVLVLDEATSSLDSESEHLIQDALDKLMRGKTVIVIAHRLSTIMKMDRIVVLKDGVIVEEGKHEELLAEGKLYSRLWNIQSGGFLKS